MSLGPVKPAMPSVSAQISGAPKEHVTDHAEEENLENREDREGCENSAERQDNPDTEGDQQKPKGPDGDLDLADRGGLNRAETEKILRKAIEAELPKVNVLNHKGKKVVPDISGMVINILT